jgi:hypothetical protein
MNQNQNQNNLAQLSTEQLMELINKRLTAELPAPLYPETKMQEIWVGGYLF